MKTDYMQQTQDYSTWGDKLLQHTDRLYNIQVSRTFYPITLQLAPTEVCDSDCSFCSVGNRPSGKIPWDAIEKGINDFVDLGIKAIELTGGGNPTLYRDGEKNINSIIELCDAYCLDIGVITNTENLLKRLTESSMQRVKWVRVSLAKLDEGMTAKDFDFSGLPEGKLGLSYIVHEKTTPKTFEMIQEIAQANPSAKFVRIAPNCLNDDALFIKEKWGPLVATLDPRFFIKEINDNYHPFQGGCWVGMLRPYWTSTGIYICTSHVLQKRTYLPEYRMCGPENIYEAWEAMNNRFANGQAPYDIDISKCQHCYYRNSNAFLNTVIREMPDKNFA